jgi:hypothetical protein
LVNLCVALANAYITPLPLSPDELKTETGPVSQQPAATTKKGAKADPQAAATAGVPAGPSTTGIKNEDLKAALEVI